jgi:SAM-dependent methyltransferase
MSSEVAGATRYYRWIHDIVKGWVGQRVLEVGPGFGNVATLLAADGREYVGIDLDAGIVDRLRAAHGDLRGVTFLHGDVSDPAVRVELAARGFDTVMSFNVLEHLADPAAHLTALRAIAPGARLVVLVPALPVLYGTLDEQAGHYLRYRRQELGDLLRRVADDVELRYFNPIGAVGWFVAARLLRLPLDGEVTNQSIRFYDRFVVPLSRSVDPLTSRWFGQSLVGRARLRPADRW